jgi:hypothetical protein
MLDKINNLINYIDNEDSVFHKKLIVIAKRLSDPIHHIEIDVKTLRSMVKPELADTDIEIPRVEIPIG